MAVADTFLWLYEETLVWVEKHLTIEPVLTGLENLRSVKRTCWSERLTDSQVELTVDQYVELADRVDSDVLTWCFDPANEVWLGHDPGADIRALGRRITLVDLKDIEESAGDRVFGRGRTDFADVAAALNETGYDGWLIVEQSNLDHLPQVVQAARAVFALR